MKRRPQFPPSELTLTDGTKTLGRIEPTENAFDVFDTDGAWFLKTDTLAEARSAILRRARGARE